MRYWSRCLSLLENEIPTHQFNLWIRPLQAEEKIDRIQLYAPNPYVFDWVKSNCLERLNELVAELAGEAGRIPVSLSIGSRPKDESPAQNGNSTSSAPAKPGIPASYADRSPDDGLPSVSSNLTAEYTFESFVEGKSNQIAKAAALQIGENPGKAYNPLFIYGGVGLGKTHLMHAVGLKILQNNPKARVTYVNSERFVNDMVRALRHNKMSEFKSVYRSLDALLIDDIQFFAGKERSQEEFFHTFNALTEANCQIILSSDRFPKELSGLEERLKSRFSWGLTVAIEPPDLETRVAILKSKAAHLGCELPNEVAFFVGKRVRSNIRELEGALRRLAANSQFSGKPINLEFAKNALKDMLAAQDKMVSIDNIQKTTAEYYQIRVSELLSKKRSRSIARPRQIAMTLAKELTSHSLPEIGEAFGGRDHTTVLHATRKIKELVESDTAVAEDYANLLRTLTN